MYEYKNVWALHNTNAKDSNGYDIAPDYDTMMNMYAKQGWRVISIIQTTNNASAILVTFEREVRQ